MTVEHLCFSYPCGRKILEDISFAADAGECLAVLGNNGAGKSTLLKCFSHILRPQSGRVLVDGRDILSLSLGELAREAALMTQSAPSTRLTVYDTLLLGRKPYMKWGVSQHDRAVVADILRQLELEPFAMRYLDQLSGGEQQKVMLARAIAQEPKLLLLDEPTSSLDLRNQYESMELIRHCAHDHHIAVLVVIHDLNLALRFCDRFLFLQGGTIFASGGAEAVTPENIRAVYGMEASVEQFREVPVVIPLFHRHEPCSAMYE